MCEKQCRDENGFKCHCNSESHQRQMILFAENSEFYISDFSKRFQSEYLKILSRMHGTRRVNANAVYQEYIESPTNVHMTATKWVTLTDFVKDLEKEGLVILEEEEKGLFVTWIDSSPETLAQKESGSKKAKLERTDAERNARILNQQIEAGKAVVVPQTEVVALQKDVAPVKLSLQFTKTSTASSKAKPSWLNAAPVSTGAAPLSAESRKLTAIEQIIHDESKKRRLNK